MPPVEAHEHQVTRAKLESRVEDMVKDSLGRFASP